MAAAHDRFCRNCVNEKEFLRQLDDVKQDSKTQKSCINVFVTDEFYSKAQNFLEAKGDEETTTDISQNDMAKHELQIIKRKKWNLNADNQIVTSEGKLVLCRCQLYKNLLFAHQRVAHRGCQKTEKWIQDSFSEVTQKVVNLFAQLCRYAEQKPITNRVKEVTKPLQEPAFLSLIELHLMDFHKTPCKCGKHHQWVLNIIDHHTKYITCSPIKKQNCH